MWVACEQCPLRVKAMFRQFSPEELVFVSQAKIGQHRIAARRPVVDPATAKNEMYSLLAGWAYRFKSLPNGARQILDFLLPGDLIGLPTPMIGLLRHGVIALTEVTVCEIATGATKTLFESQPGLSAALVQTLLIDDERADRRLLMLGRQRPTERLAYLLLELFERMERRDGVADGSCRVPVTYEHLADALGLSRAQLARSLAEVRDRGWARLERGRLELFDRAAMTKFADYDATIEREKRGLI